MERFLDLTAENLLKEFGAGKHIPGAGSAAALSGLLAAQLVLTVATLTLNNPSYRRHHPRMAAICTRVRDVLIPELERLFQQDAEAFDRAYKERVARDKATDEVSRQRHASAAIELLRPATHIPLQIAAICVELIDHATKVFNDGFKFARGDTGVALSTAVSAVMSCVFIINLNLKSFEPTLWAAQRRKECDRLQSEALEKYEHVVRSLRTFRGEMLAALKPIEGYEPILAFGNRSKESHTVEEIEDRARRLGVQMWQRRGELWKGLEKSPTDPIQVLDPERALKMLGYTFDLEESLGTFTSNGTAYEIAGLLEAQPGRVRVSRKMPSEVRLFTAAHELGHVILHPHLKEAHRDRPLDGSDVSREDVEREADRFAAAFLMPEKQVRLKFAAIFSAEPFQLTEDTAFALGLDFASMRQKIMKPRDFALLLARTGRFNGKNVVPLANQFRVSVATMAIRLEELELIKTENP